LRIVRDDYDLLARRPEYVEHALDERREPEVDEAVDRRHVDDRPGAGNAGLVVRRRHGRHAEQRDASEQQRRGQAAPGVGSRHWSASLS